VVSAQVVQVEAVWNLTSDYLVHDPVGTCCRLADVCALGRTVVEQAITVPVVSTIPVPARTEFWSNDAGLRLNEHLGENPLTQVVWATIHVCS
jgi:hypothetical protein